MREEKLEGKKERERVIVTYGSGIV